MIVPGTTVSGIGSSRRLRTLIRRFGLRGLVVHGQSVKASGRLDAMLEPETGALTPDVCTWQHPGGEPTLDHLRSLLAVAREFRPDWMAAVGGGSVIDVAKAAAGLIECTEDVLTYHAGARPERPGIPMVAVPTTAGTGSEATPNSVLIDAAAGVKKSIRDDAWVPAAVILDGGLLATCPREVIAHSGMDALTQAIEAFTSRKATAYSDALARQGIELIHRNLAAVHSNPSGPEAQSLIEGSYLTGVALSLARLGVVHGLAHPLGLLYHQPHGLVCAVCLPAALRFNRESVGRKYVEISEILGGDAVDVCTALSQRLGVASPFRGREIINPELIIAETLASGSTAANPRAVERADVEWFLREIFA